MEEGGYGFSTNIGYLLLARRKRFADTNQQDEAPVGSIATYSCRPGYTYVSGNLQRKCLPSLIWSGRRPTCVPVCEVAYPQTCKNCNALASNKPHCTIVYQTHTTSDFCRNLTYSSPYSVNYNGSACLFSDCHFVMDGSIAQGVFLSTTSCSRRKYLDKRTPKTLQH